MWRTLACCVLLAGRATVAAAFGPEGHVIAGLVAEPLLCAGARAEIRALDRDVRADLSDFAELGVWADRIRSDSKWQRSGPWHYMNIDAVAADLATAERAIRAFAHPDEGNVLHAIERFATVLGDRAQAPSDRADALRFLVHFVVDVHQPLHVGLAGDRGGNTIDVRVGAAEMSLHRFWDSEAIALADRSPRRYAAVLAARTPPPHESDDPAVWAAESLLLRPQVYAGLKPSGVSTLTPAYVTAAQAITADRLAQAGRRVAATLNRLLCR